jgi:hypothetical protein
VRVVEFVISHAQVHVQHARAAGVVAAERSETGSDSDRGHVRDAVAEIIRLESVRGGQMFHGGIEFIGQHHGERIGSCRGLTVILRQEPGAEK